MTNFSEALELVLELAEQNVLTESQCYGSPELGAARDKQESACAIVRARLEVAR